MMNKRVFKTCACLLTHSHGFLDCLFLQIHASIQLSKLTFGFLIVLYYVLQQQKKLKHLKHLISGNFYSFFGKLSFLNPGIFPAKLMGV